MNRLFYYSISVLLSLPIGLYAQTDEDKYPIDKEEAILEIEASKKHISLKDIWKDYKFMQESVSGLRSMNDGEHYTVLERTSNGVSLVQYAYKTGEKVKTLINADDLTFEGTTLIMDNYVLSAEENKALIATDVEPIYRHSKKAYHYIYDMNTKKISPLSEGEKQMYATFSPSGDKVAFVRENNLFYKDLTSGNEIAITTDGEKNKIINAASDWVYEEELKLVRAFEWSPDGEHIAYFRFDESQVKEWNMKIYDGLYPSEERFKYPKAGEDNSKVEAKIYNLSKNQSTTVELREDYEYLISMVWANARQLAIMSSNRHQNKLNVNLVNAEDGNSTIIHREVSDTYIEMPFEIEFTKDEKHFIIQSENSGFNHIYLYKMNGKLAKQLTKGNYTITKFYGIDEANGLIYYQAADENPMNRNVFQGNLKGKNPKKISQKKGTNNAVFSKTFSYFINYHTTANQPNYISLHQANGEEIRMLKDNSNLKKEMDEYEISPKEFFSFKTTEGVHLNAWMIKPVNFDAEKKYPVFITIYGGPGSQTVTNSWGGMDYFWHQMLAQKGYLVISVDNRGTGGRGADFKKQTYKELGKYETIDLIETAKYLSTLDYVDGERIGIFGWSYGGYMSSLCILKGADYFKAAIAVAPVTTWRYYDTIYTERYMQTPQENPKGYDDNSPINFVDRLKGEYLLVHGMADDNVHLQNTSDMISALVEADKQFELLVYPNKNHGIYGGNTRFHLYQKMTNFIVDKL